MQVEVEEAAYTLGASPWKAFTTVSLVVRTANRVNLTSGLQDVSLHDIALYCLVDGLMCSSADENARPMGKSICIQLGLQQSPLHIGKHLFLCVCAMPPAM